MAEGEAITEIEDFTCASPWELLVANTEAVLRGWGLDGAEADGAASSTTAAPRQSRLRHPYGGATTAIEYSLRHSRHDSPSATAGLGTSPRESFNLASQGSTTEVESRKVMAYFGIAEYVSLRVGSTVEGAAGALTPGQLLSVLLVAMGNCGVTLPALVPCTHPDDGDDPLWIGRGALPLLRSRTHPSRGRLLRGSCFAASMLLVRRWRRGWRRRRWRRDEVELLGRGRAVRGLRGHEVDPAPRARHLPHLRHTEFKLDRRHYSCSTKAPWDRK
jgi:hypothetical protein